MMLGTYAKVSNRKMYQASQKALLRASSYKETRAFAQNGDTVTKMEHGEF